jgi:hypothetical protein
LNSLLPLAFQLLGDQDDEVSSNMVSFMSSYMMQLKAKQKTSMLSEQERQYIVTMLQIVRNKARYTEDFHFDPLTQDEYEAGFLEYRRELMILFKNSVRLLPDLVKEFTKSSLIHALSNQGAPFSETEIGLTLFYHIGEMFSEGTGEDDYFATLLGAIIEASTLTFLQY